MPKKKQAKSEPKVDTQAAVEPASTKPTTPEAVAPTAQTAVNTTAEREDIAPPTAQATQTTQTKPDAQAAAPVADPAPVSTSAPTPTQAKPEPKKSYKVATQPIQTVQLKKSGGMSIYFGSVSPIDVALSIRHLSIMLKSGLALEAAVKVLSEQSNDQRLKKAYAEILTYIQSGKTLAESMRMHPKIFSDITVSIISIGEQGGTLETNLVFLAEFLKKQYELQRKVKGALIYPMIVFTLTFVEMMGVIFFILPKMDALFSAFDNLPAFTVFILKVSKFFRQNVFVVSGVIAIIASIIFAFLKTKSGKIFKDKLGLNFPIIKRLNKDRILTTFSRTLGILLESGIPISTALKISSETIGSNTYEKILAKVYEEVKSGKTLAASLARYPKYFPPTYIKIIEVGESTGSLEESLNYMYEYYEEEVEDMANNLTTILEPLLLIFIGLMIGVLAVIIIAPIYQLTGSLNE